MKFSIQNLLPKKSKYCLAIITLNEGERLLRQLENLLPYNHLIDLIIVDGESTDGSTSREILEKYHVKTLLTVHELGLGTATRIALKYCMDEEYEGIITMDGNGKDGMESVPLFVNALEEGFDLVQGGRFLKGGHHKNTPLERIIGIRLIMAPMIALATGYWFNDPTNAFRAISSLYIKDTRLGLFRPIFVHFNFQIYILYQAAKRKYKIKEIPVSRVYPDDGSIPTKIIGWRIKLKCFKELCKTVLGHYNPL